MKLKSVSHPNVVTKEEGYRICPTCDGKGVVFDSLNNPHLCPKCDGEKKIKIKTNVSNASETDRDTTVLTFRGA